MKKIILFILLFANISFMAFGAIPDSSAKTIICLDRKYNFLDKDNYVDLKSGGEHIALIRDDNSLWMFGSNEDGKLGIGEIRNAYNAPVKVLENVERVKANSDGTMALKKDGSAWFFGNTINSVPTKSYDNVLDADCNGISSYVDKGGNAYYINFNQDKIPLCSDAKEIYILSSEGGDGLLSKGGSTTGAFIVGGMKDVISKPTFYIEVLKSNGDLYEYAVGIYGNLMDYKFITSGVKKVETNGTNITLDMGSGRYLVGSTSSGLTEKNLPGSVKYQSGFYLKEDGLLYREVTNECVGSNVKLFGAVAIGLGVFMVHNDNSVSAYSVNPNMADFASRLNAVNGGRTYLSHNYNIKEDDILNKVRELCGLETDDYINAKNISKWIGKNIVYKGSAHDQSGVQAFRKGSGVCAAFSELTTIMFTYAGIPTYSCKSIAKDHAWNMSIIDGVTVFIDNTGSFTENSFDMGMFSQGITDNADYNNCFYDEWAATEVRGAYDWDLIDRFLRPDFKNPIMRDEFCFIVRAAIEKAKGKSIDAVISEYGKSSVIVPFEDTQDADVFAMYKLGVVNGTSATTFSPKREITREEAAKIMFGLAKIMGDNTSSSQANFKDGNSISDWAQESVNFVATYGIMKGKPEGFDPKNTISIQETAIICYRYVSK